MGFFHHDSVILSGKEGSIQSVVELVKVTGLILDVLLNIYHCLFWLLLLFKQSSESVIERLFISLKF